MVWELTEILASIGVETISFLPNLISGVILLLIGLVIGKIMGRVVYEVLQKAKLDYYITEEKKPVVHLSSIFALGARWWIYIVFVEQAVQILGLETMTIAFARIVTFIPNVVGAAAIIISGYVIGEYIRHHLIRVNRLYAELVGKVSLFFIVYVAIALALPILGVPAALVNNILLIIVASVGLGVAIALGLGLKDVVADIGKKYTKKMKI